MPSVLLRAKREVMKLRKKEVIYRQQKIQHLEI